jgi:hypothetical protein
MQISLHGGLQFKTVSDPEVPFFYAGNLAEKRFFYSVNVQIHDGGSGRSPL